MDEFCEGLKAEIEFWHELLEQTALSQASPEYIRMQQALRLAKAKLSDCEFELMNSVSHSVEH